MSVQSVALASLTATYTDSEGDDGPDDDHHESRNSEHVETTVNSNIMRSRNRESPFVVGSSSNSPDRLSDNGGVVGHIDNDNVVQNLSVTMAKNAPTLVTDVTSKVHRLVSYFDDTIVSDDEGTANASLIRDIGFNGDNDNASFVKTKNESMQSPKRRGDSVSDIDTNEASWGVTIPPEPSGQCPQELQDKITNLYRKMESGLDMNRLIQQRKEFRNPSIYEKLIQFCSINEMGTNYPPDRFDPFKWGKDSYYEELARIQKTEMDKLEKARKEKTKIEIVTGTAKRPSSNTSTADEDAKRRKSKWDQVATGTTASVKSSVVMSQPTLTTLTSSATGTKATVISAFGSLPKKRL